MYTWAALIRRLKNTPLTSYGGRVLSSHLDTVMRWVLSGVQKTMIKMIASDVTLLAKVRTQFDYFLRIQEGDGEGGALQDGALLFGKAACVNLLENLQGAKEAGNDVGLGSVQDLVVFDYLLDDTQRAEVRKYVDAKMHAPSEHITKKAKTGAASSAARASASSSYYFRKAPVTS